VAVALFEFDDVVVRAGTTTILNGLIASVPAEGITVLFGPSGAGKSTTLRLCNRLELATSGTVRFRGDDVAHLDPLALRRRVGMVFQRPTLFDGTVLDNLRVARPDLAAPEAAAALERVGLPGDLLERDAKVLSGGEGQRACLARTLVTEPEVLLMDEPTASLDAANVTLLERLVRGLADAGRPVIWVTHDEPQRRRLADYVIRIDGGRATAAGPDVAA
jgi:putative ABC transport system ATP-binding protein